MRDQISEPLVKSPKVWRFQILKNRLLMHGFMDETSKRLSNKLRMLVESSWKSFLMKFLNVQNHWTFSLTSIFFHYFIWFLLWGNPTLGGNPSLPYQQRRTDSHPPMAFVRPRTSPCRWTGDRGGKPKVMERNMDCTVASASYECYVGNDEPWAIAFLGWKSSSRCLFFARSCDCTFGLVWLTISWFWKQKKTLQLQGAEEWQFCEHFPGCFVRKTQLWQL